ncbi:hypothetical protein BDF14DRAFT_1816068 [Spinellus fusiger]|nr:hypothetical protein BDF14DRAFT_1816068 [Spinellus fusiger]
MSNCTIMFICAHFFPFLISQLLSLSLIILTYTYTCPLSRLTLHNRINKTPDCTPLFSVEMSTLNASVSNETLVKSTEKISDTMNAGIIIIVLLIFGILLGWLAVAYKNKKKSSISPLQKTTFDIEKVSVDLTTPPKVYQYSSRKVHHFNNSINNSCDNTLINTMLCEIQSTNQYEVLKPYTFLYSILFPTLTWTSNILYSLHISLTTKLPRYPIKKAYGVSTVLFTAKSKPSSFGIAQWMISRIQTNNKVMPYDAKESNEDSTSHTSIYVHI